MHVVAITRALGHASERAHYREASKPREPLTREALAALLVTLRGETAYDWFLRLGTPLPWLVANEQDQARADSLVRTFAAEGLDAVALDPDEARPWSSMGFASVSLAHAHLEIAPEGMRVPLEELDVAVVATIEQETTKEEVQHVLVDRRNRVTMPVSQYQGSRTRARALYLFAGERRRAIRLVQAEAGLSNSAAQAATSPLLAPTSFQRFDELLDSLASAAPHLRWDRRLVDAPRARNRLSLRADGTEKSTTNQRETDLVARIIALATLRGTID